MNAPVRLTSLAHGGGCGCKLAPAVLQELLAGMPQAAQFPGLLVGADTADDAAVWQVDETTCVIATTDFFTPIVDDPYDFGRIAATNALSDVYAMGGRPIMALAILGMPVDKLPVETVRQILAGGASVCAAAGIPVAGGHSIDVPEPIYGLAAIGLCHPSEVRRNTMAEAGDALILTKPIGVGVYSAAIKKGRVDGADYAEMIASTTMLNRVGADLAKDARVHALTDVTGFGLLGHALELARGSNLGIRLDPAAVPVLSRAREFAAEGLVTGASLRNFASYGADVVLPAGLPEWMTHLLTDPQTSGGLLVACAPDAAAAVLEMVRAAGHRAASIIGRAEQGAPRIIVEDSM
jgi:selenide,water dikinase